MSKSTIEQLRELSPELESLACESELEGFRFLRRLIDEWLSGENRFDRPGEAFFGAYVEGSLVGVCGLNRDPYVNQPGVGRVRRTYVSPGFRRQGVGGTLIEIVIGVATGSFEILQLRSQRESIAFYEAVGFRPVTGEDHVTHRLSLVGGRNAG